MNPQNLQWEVGPGIKGVVGALIQLIPRNVRLTPSNELTSFLNKSDNLQASEKHL